MSGRDHRGPSATKRVARLSRPASIREQRAWRGAALAAAAALGLLLFAPGSALALAGGPEIPVNTTTAGNQTDAAIARNPDGGFTVVWQSDEQDGDGSGVYARRFDSAGKPLGGEIAVNATTVGNQNSPAIAPDGDGGFTVAWISSEYHEEEYTTTFTVYARRFDAAGEPLGGEIVVSSFLQGLLGAAPTPAIAPDGEGGFTVAWTSSDYDEQSEETVFAAYARRFDAAGDPRGSEIAIDVSASPSAFVSGDAAIAPDPDGGFTVAWNYSGASIGWEPPCTVQCYGPSSSNLMGDVYARRFDADGTPLTGKIRVGAGSDAAITPAPDGGFTVAWGIEYDCGWSSSCSPYSSFAQHFDAAGDPLGDEIAISGATEPAIAPDPGGGVTVAWQASWLDGGGVFARRFDAAGDPLGDAIAVNLAMGYRSGPAMAPDGDGGFTVAWQSAGQDGSGFGIYARRFFADLPDTRIDSGPAGFTNDTTPTFAFSSDEEPASFECRLDGGGYSPCSSPYTTTLLPDGEHTFEVQATNEAGKADPVPASRSFTVDTEPPDTEIDCGPYDCDPLFAPPGTPHFMFSSSEESWSFECRYFAQGETPPAFHACQPIDLSGLYYSPGSLPDGDYTFEVRATDQAGNTDPTPAALDFTFDGTGPDTQIDSGPPDGASTSNDSPSFGFSSTAGDLDHFSCRLSGPGGTPDDDPCQSPRNYTDLADGDYTFSVRATDLVSNLGPASVRHFTVDTVAPDTQIDSGPAGPTNDPTPRFAFSSNEAGASFECRLDGGAYSACSLRDDAAMLSDGPHTFEVRAVDEAANTDPSPASRSFTVDTEAPETQIDSGPAGLTNNPSPTFEFSSSEPANFECRLDDGDYRPCSSPLSTPLFYGPHTFRVRATDLAGNTDSSPASRSFAVGWALTSPTRGKTVIVAPVKGLVRVREPGEGRFHRLRGSVEVPVKTRVDTTHGRVALTSAARRGKTQTADFYGGAFQVRQQASGDSTTELRLLSKRSRTQRGHRGRDEGGAGLWGNGHGDYTTHGKYGSATVRGTIWFTQDLPTGTFFKVRRGVVVVRDFTRHRKLKLHPGQHYLAPAR